MIEIKNLFKKFDDKVVLSDLNVVLASNQILGVMGRNGAGKTTLLQAILGQISFEGTIEIDKDLLSPRGKISLENLVFVGDNPHLYNYLTAVEYIDFFLAIKGKTAVSRERVYQLLNVLGLSEEDAQRVILEYSFGMRRKTALAAAFLANPKLMILDEPTIGLDVPSILAVKSLIKKSNQMGGTFLITAHDPNLMSDICTGLMILNEGKIVYNNSDLKSESRSLSEVYMQAIGENLEKKVSELFQS